MRSTSSNMLFSLRGVTMRPWWYVSAQKAQLPKQPRCAVTENFTSSMAGTPSLYIGCGARAKGSAYTKSICFSLSGSAGRLTTT